MLAKLRILLIAVLALVAVPETIFADDSAKVTALEALLKQYMDENAELKKAIAEQGASEPDVGGDVVVDEAIAPAESADATVRLELYSSEVICKRSKLNDNEDGPVAKMDARKFADEAKRRGLNCVDGSKDVNTKVDKVCRSNLTDCSDEVLCELSTHNDGSVKWRSGLSAAGGYIEFVNEAQARGLDCGVENAATSTHESYTCEDNPASCNAQHLCEFATTRTGSSVTWSSDPASRPYVDEARKQQLACSLTFPLASCKGWNGTVNVLSGINSTKATMTGHVLAKDLKEYCTRDPGGETTNYGGKLSIDQCVAKYLAQKNDPLRTTANCETGDLVFERYSNGEKKVSKQTFPLGIGTETSCASGLMPLEAQFAMLCPTNAGSDDWIAAGQQRKADAEKHKADAQAAEQKRLEDEKQKKADADAKAAEQKRLADEKQKKADADAQAVEQKRLADEERKKADADAQAAEQKRLADEKQKKADADARVAEQVRIAEEEKRKVALAAQAEEQKRLADEKQKADADALAAKQKQIVDENVIAETGVSTVAEFSIVDQSDFEKELRVALGFYNSGDYPSALRVYLSLAEQGSRKAQYSLGLMYQNGKGVPQDYAESLRWYRLAADQGMSEGQNSVGYFYDNGLGVPQDFAEAIKWYRLASAQGFPNAQRNLGLMFAKGNGVPQDYSEAVKLLQLAADQRDGKAQYNLGLMYKEGNGIPQDDDEAVELLVKAADNDITLDAATQFYIGLIYQKRERYNYAAEWYKLAADQGFVPAQSKLGILYVKGRGVSKDLTAAVKWVRLAADQSFAEGQVSLGSMYENGIGVLQDYSEAMKWYQLAADQGYADGQNNVGMMYISGLGRPQSYSLGTKWLRLAAEQNNAIAQTNLGMLYDVAPGYSINVGQALALSSGKLQMNLLGQAQMAIGPIDNVKANMWYLIALSNFEESEISVSDAYIGTIYSPKDLREIMALRLQPSEVSQSQSMASQCVNSGYKDCGW